MKITKMNVTGQLDPHGADRFARQIGLSYVLAAIGVLVAGLAGLVAAVRWW